MPKPRLNDEFQTLETDLLETFLAGHHEWRPDLHYPESHSDMSGGMRELMRQFEIKRRPEPLPVQHMLSADEQGCKCVYCVKGAASSASREAAKEKNKFEEWASSRPQWRNAATFLLRRGQDGQYEDVAVAIAWETWQAALASRIRGK